MADGKVENKVNENELPTCSLQNVDIVPPYIPFKFRRHFLQNMVKNLPASVQTRVIALKNLQLKVMEIQREYWDEVCEIEQKYRQKFEPLMEKRKEIVAGQTEPPKEEPKWPSAKDEDNKFDNLQGFERILKEYQNIPEDIKGIPNFWLTILKNCGSLNEIVWDHDEPALKKLLDIKVKYAVDGSFTLEFLFDENEYFTDSVLTKTYYVKSHLDEQDPFNYDGPEIYNCEGCNINWKENMNMTVQPHRKATFFNFFYPPQIPNDAVLIDTQTKDILQSDFQIGNWLRVVLIPKAVLFYSGDIVLDDLDDDDSENNGEEDEQDSSRCDCNGNAPQKS